MCGICGYTASKSLDVSRVRVSEMLDTIVHRGPDSRGVYIDNDLAMGFQRLSIIDLETGDQPLFNESEELVLICNGEIYNYIELTKDLEKRGHRFRTKSDAEVILHLYEEMGTGLLAHLRGMFAFALWDLKKKRLMLARDRFGMKPLYFSLWRQSLLFASELKAILTHAGFPRELNKHALVDHFDFGFIPGTETLFKQIQSLPAAHFILFAGEKNHQECYWSPADIPASRFKSKAHWQEAYHAAFQESIKLHMRSDVPMGAWLSPGIDSSAVIATMAQFTNKPIKTFSVIFDSKNDEFTNQKTLRDFPQFPIESFTVKCDHSHLELLPDSLWHNEIPFSGIQIPRLLLGQITSDHHKVIMTGEGSDESLGGYTWYRSDKIIRCFSLLPPALKKRLAESPLISRRWPGFSRILLLPCEMNLKRFQHMIGPGQSLVLGQTIFSDQFFIDDVKEKYQQWLDEQGMQLSRFRKMQLYDMMIRLPNAINTHLDRSTMACSVEARLPLLDHPLVELCWQMPEHLKVRGFNEKYIMRRAFKNILPDEIRTRKKYPMSLPYNEWLIKSRSNLIEYYLAKETIIQFGLFNPELVPKLLIEHRTKNPIYGQILMQVLSMQIWFDLFINCKSLQKM